MLRSTSSRLMWRMVKRGKTSPPAERRSRVLILEQLQSRESPTDVLGTIPAFLLGNSSFNSDSALSSEQDPARLDVLSFENSWTANDFSSASVP
jgi:hypothetical protein